MIRQVVSEKIMKESRSVRSLRLFIRSVIAERAPGPVVGVDPTNLDTSPNGFYPYEIERGVDLQSFWYKSPGRSMGGDGDPGERAVAPAPVQHGKPQRRGARKHCRDPARHGAAARQQPEVRCRDGVRVGLVKPPRIVGLREPAATALVESDVMAPQYPEPSERSGGGGADPAREGFRHRGAPPRWMASGGATVPGIRGVAPHRARATHPNSPGATRLGGIRSRAARRADASGAG